MYQLHHLYTNRTLSFNQLQTKVAIMFADKTDEACRSNVSLDLSGVQSISIITTLLFADCEKVVKCQLTYLVFRIASKPSNVRE